MGRLRGEDAGRVVRGDVAEGSVKLSCQLRVRALVGDEIFFFFGERESVRVTIPGQGNLEVR